MLAVKRLRKTGMHGNAMLYNPVLLQDLVQNGKSPATIDHVVLRNDLEPVDDRLLRENMVVVRYPKADQRTPYSVKPLKRLAGIELPVRSPQCD